MHVGNNVLSLVGEFGVKTELHVYYTALNAHKFLKHNLKEKGFFSGYLIPHIKQPD